MERPWSAGDNVQLATGQGDLQTNPLQMAIAYAALGNGGTVVTPHVGLEVDDAAGRVLQEFDPGPQRHVQIDPDIPRGRSSKACTTPPQSRGGTSYDVFGSFPIEVAGKTGTAQRPPDADQSWYAVLAPYPDPEIVTVVTMEEGGFGAEAAAPAAQRSSKRISPRQRLRKAPNPKAAKKSDVRDPQPPGAPGALRGQARDRRAAQPALHGRGPRLLGRGAGRFSVFTLSQATRHDVPGNPGYYTDRQTIYAVLGIVGMYLLARVDYSRFRELRVGIYTFLCASISLVFVFGFAARGSRRSFDLPFFSFQPSELGKLLLVLALAGFVIDGARRGSPRQRTVRYLCLGLAPAALVFLQPDLGTALVFGAITLAVMYVGGVPWTHFAAIAGAGRIHRTRPLRRPSPSYSQPSKINCLIRLDNYRNAADSPTIQL